MPVIERDAPSLVRYVPELHLRILITRWKFDKHFSGSCGQGYVDWLHREEESLASFYGYHPSPSQLRRAVAASIVDEDAFIKYLEKEGRGQVPDDEDELANLAKAAAGVIVALYEDSVGERRADHGA
jgi:hypothetical protein